MARMARGRALVLGIVVSVVGAALAPRARADAVEPPPASCPRGSTPVSSHGGPHCAPTACTTMADCSPETMRSCEPIGLCIEIRSGYAMGGPFTFDAVTGECTSPADCAGGSRCELASRCVDPGGSLWIAIGGGICAAFVALIGLVLAVFTLASRRGAGPRAP